MALKGTVKYTRHHDEVLHEIGSFIHKAVDKSTKVMELNVKVNTPVKEGHARRSVRSRMTGFGQGEVYNAATEGGKEIDYFVHLEYGTKFMAPRAPFRKGVAQSEDKIQEIFGDEAKGVKTKAG